MSKNNYTCALCKNLDFESNEVETLKCGHIFCWSCLASYIDKNLDSKVCCPIDNCNRSINDSIIRQAIPDNRIIDYEKLSLSKVEQCFNCLLNECDNIVFYSSKQIQFECCICSMFNCISCSATHPFISCQEYQKKKNSAFTNIDDKLFLETMEKNEMERAREKLLSVRHKQFLTVYQELESYYTIPNDVSFECLICCKIVPKGIGIKLRNCYHMFCRNCLNENIKNSEILPIQCLNGKCESKIQEREIRGILNDRDYEIFHEKGLTLAKSKLDNIFHCKTPDCKYFGICDIDLTNFVCPVCKSRNCIKCNVIHKNSETCDEYQIGTGNKSSIDDMSLDYIAKEIREGKCMKCPTCGCIIKKSGGCNWIKCPQCKLELCWILKIPRWGPKGQGDLSGGCRCGVNNVLCHPTCKVGCIPDNNS